jgi:hypothetical protein
LALTLSLSACGPGETGDDPLSTDALDTTGAARIPTCSSVRALHDLADDSAGDQVRVLYVLPADGKDEHLDTSGQVCDSVRSFSRWMRGQTGGKIMRLDTHQGKLDIGFVRLVETDFTIRGWDPSGDLESGTHYVRDRIERALARRGLINRPNKLYAVYYGGTSTWACGGGAYPPELPGRVAGEFLGGKPSDATVPCTARPWGQATGLPAYIDYGMLHELLHSIGIVAHAAPNQHDDHVFDSLFSIQPERDLMYQARPGNGFDPPWGVFEPGGLILDINHDDYYGHGKPFIDLAKSSLLTPRPRNARRPPGW